MNKSFDRLPSCEHRDIYCRTSCLEEIGASACRPQRGDLVTHLNTTALSIAAGSCRAVVMMINIRTVAGP